MRKRERTRVLRTDGKPINLVKKRGHLLVCATGCCCGRTERGHAAVPLDLYKQEWKRRKLRNKVHLTIGGCLGPCTLSNVVLLLFDGKPLWFQSINSAPQVLAIYDYIDQMLAADRYMPPPAELAEYVFQCYTWPQFVSAAPIPTFSAETKSPLPSPSVLFLTHADTDLLTLHHALLDLPPDFPAVYAVSLNKIKTDEHMTALLAEYGQGARIVIVRLLGGINRVPGLHQLIDLARTTGKHLLLISGTGSLDPELTAASTVSPALIHETTAYFQAGGRINFVQQLRFLADHLLLTGFGYEPPSEQPLHGIYHPDLPLNPTLTDWLARHNPDKPTIGLLFYRAHWMSGNLAFIDAFVKEIETRGANALPVFTVSLKETTEMPDHFALHWRKEDRTQSGLGTLADPSVSYQQKHWPAAFQFLLHSTGQPLVDVLITTLSFATGEINPEGPTSPGWSITALSALDVPVLQAITGSTMRWQWETSPRGLNPLDTAMNIALPEFDGRIITVPISFKERFDSCPQCADPSGAKEQEDRALSDPLHAGITTGSPPDTAFDVIHYVPAVDRISRVVGLALRFALLRRKPNAEKRIAFVLTNSPGKAARIGNAVGLDAPASLMRLFAAMQTAGYCIENLPPDGDTLLQRLIDRCSYDETFLTTEQLAHAAGHVPVDLYERWFRELPEAQRQQMIKQWGPPPGEAYVHDGQIALAGLEFGKVFVALQPPRGYGMDPNAIYHRPDLPPPHNYYALYRWLRDIWGADAIVHVGKHGTLEWLPGKGVGLSAECFPDTFLLDLPLFYPFILNNPGEGAQAKRRAHAVLIDHLVPPMTTADTYGELAQLAQLVDEYYQVEMLDPSKLPLLQQQIWDLIKHAHLDKDLQYLLSQDHGDHVHTWDEKLTPDGTPVTLAQMRGREVAHLIEDLDGYLCELAGAQIRDGLHILGEVPAGEQMIGLLQALTRLPNLEVPSLRASVAALFGLDLNLLLANRGHRLENIPPALVHLADRPLVTHADALETIDELCAHLLSLLQRNHFDPTAIEKVLTETFLEPCHTPALQAVLQVLQFVCTHLVPSIHQTEEEITNLLHALEGGYVPAGPSGAPTRGMAHVLPAGRNFYAVDPRTLPSMAAWQIGQELAREVVDRYVAETKTYPECVGISVWGTSAMRTHGDDIAEIFALLGVRPVWQRENRRLVGVEVIPLAELGRPRIDVVVRISGFFRDAFPHLIRLLDEAIEMVTHLDEPLDHNFVRKHYLADLAANIAAGLDAPEAELQARYRIFGSKPGTYGAGILPLIDERNWHSDADFAEAYVNWGGYAYTAEKQGVDARRIFRHRLSGVEVALHNQDNREHDIFDSDDYLQFHGGMIATIRALTGRKPSHYFGDTHDPAHPAVRDLQEEVLRVFRTRVVNPKWLEGITRHGYKGGLELTATVDYLFGYDATADVVEDWMYEQVAQSYALDPAMQEFFVRSNPWALHAITERLLEAAQRGLWNEPHPETFDALQNTFLSMEAILEERGETTKVRYEV